jgi:galactose oxidase-like protein
MAAAERGTWEVLDFDSQILAVHAALLHTGDVLFFAGSGYSVPNHEAHRFRTRVWRYPSRKFTAPKTPIDLFCCGHAFLPGGRLLAAGGTRQYDPFRGIHDALTFDPAKRRWLRVRKMAHGRWYPSLVALGDGRVAAVSGRGESDAQVRVAEVFDDGWKPLPERGVLPFYPHLTLLDDGRLFYSGGHMGLQRGARPGIWDLESGDVKAVPGLPMAKMRNQAASVLLPPAQDQRVMIVAGGGGDMHDHDHRQREPQVATRSVAIADLSAATPRYKAAARIRHARMHHNLVLLPDRTVLATGGAAVEEHRVNAALEAELFDPRSGKWRRAAKAQVPRLYHSVALLTPDGRVVTAGSNPKRGDEELRIEVYSPPYLFKGPRPSLELAHDHAGYGASLGATTNAALREVNLVRPSATTHASNTEQRLVDVPFAATGNGDLDLALPANPNLAPPGWYMVFAVSEGGVPSRGQWLHLA